MMKLLCESFCVFPFYLILSPILSLSWPCAKKATRMKNLQAVLAEQENFALPLCPLRNHSQAQVRGHYHQDSWCFARWLCLVTKRVANGCHRFYDSATRFAPSMFMIQIILCFKDWLEKVPPSPTTLLHFFLSELPLHLRHLLSLHPAFCRCCCCWKSWTRWNLGLLDQKSHFKKGIHHVWSAAKSG